MIQQMELFPPPIDTQFTPTLGFVFENKQTWADGDTSRAALERLARLLPGKRECSDWRVKPAYFYRILDTRIEGDHVVATCQIVAHPLGIQTVNPIESDEDC